MTGEQLDTLTKRGLVFAILRNKQTKEAVCMSYKEHIEAIAELFIGNKWNETYEVVNSAPCIIFSDVQVLLAMAPIMQINMPNGPKMPPGMRGGPGGMFGAGTRPGGIGRGSMFGGMMQSDDDEDEDEDDDEEDDDEDEDDDPDDTS